MYLSAFDLIGTTIALVSLMIVISITLYANRILLKENRNLRGRVIRQSRILSIRRAADNKDNYKGESND